MTTRQSAILWGVYGALIAFLLIRDVFAWIATRRERKRAQRLREKTYW